VLDPLDLIDGIDQESLVNKRTTGLMQPGLAPQIAAATRKEFPQGIPAFGTDALRFTFAAMASTGRDINFDLQRVAGYRNFCNKLWNASRFVLMNTEGQDCGQTGGTLNLTVYDRWMRSRLQGVEAEVRTQFSQYRFDLVAQTLYDLVWNQYCDWYLELVKPVLQDPHIAEATQRGTRATLVRVLASILRLLHPLMPFITEELWLKVAPLAGQSGDTLLLQPYPEADPTKLDPEAEAATEALMALVLAVRKIRGELDIKPNQAVPLWLRGGDSAAQAQVTTQLPTLRALAKVSELRWLAAAENPRDVATGLAGDFTLFVPLAGLIDTQAEYERLGKEISKLQAELSRYETKLTNADFLARAPAAVVAKDQARVSELRVALAALTTQQQALRAMA
jgi:valyl-tRNA synthetase